MNHMKCPSCGVWNRAHFTKCFRCGAELTDAAKSVTPIFDNDLIDEEPVTVAVRHEEPVSAPVQPEPQPEEELEVYSLYDNGDWDDEDEDENEAVYGMKPVYTAQPEPAPVSTPVQPELVEAQDVFLPADDDTDDEPVTVYKAPVQEPVPEALPVPEELPVQEETRKFAPITAQDASDGSTRKFDLAAEVSVPVTAQPAPAPVEPEVAPVQPGISHEIIHAIFTNPPSGTHTDLMPEPIDEPRPRKLMSRTRRPAPAVEEEPATVYKKTVSDKPEPRVDNLEAFKPTARMAAMIADEKGDEYTAFATAERKLVAEVTDADPFEAAFDIPRSSSVSEEETVQPAQTDAADIPEEAIPETIAEEPVITEDADPADAPEQIPEAQPEPVWDAPASPAQEPDIAPVIIEPVLPPQPEQEPTEPEQPAWVKEALFNLVETADIRLPENFLRRAVMRDGFPFHAHDLVGNLLCKVDLMQ